MTAESVQRKDWIPSTANDDVSSQGGMWPQHLFYLMESNKTFFSSLLEYALTHTHGRALQKATTTAPAQDKQLVT